MLELLEKRRIPHTPRVVSDGRLDGFGPYMVIEPCGRHLGSGDPPQLIAQVILDVAETIHAASSGPEEEHVLHRDVSAANVVVDDAGRGVLIDFQLARIGGADGSAPTVTGTPLFSAISVSWGHANTPSSDLEALLYTLAFIATDGKVVCPGPPACPPERIT